MGKSSSKMEGTVKEEKAIVCFIWKITNFSMLPHQNQERLVSPIFANHSMINVGLHLDLYPKGVKSDDDTFMSLFLRPTRNLDVKLNCSITLVSTEPSTHVSRSFNDVVGLIGLGYPKFLSLKEIYGKKDLYLPEDTLTIRCEVNTSKEISAILNVNDLLSDCSVGHTGVKIHRKQAITWPVQNIKQRIERQEITSILLTSAENDSPSLKLSLNFKNESEDCIGLSIKRMCLSLGDERTVIKCKVTVISANSQYQAFKESTHLFRENLNDVWHFPPFISATMLTQEKFLYANYMLFLLCEFTFSSKNDSIVNHLSYTYETGNKRVSELGSCIQNICRSGKFCDVELKAGSDTFPSYKLLLCARSPVFAAMFENNMREKNLNVVEIPDVDPNTMRRILSYMHSDIWEEGLSPSDACKLYEAADKYDIKSLKHICSIRLVSTLSVENMCDLIILADAHQDELLITALENFSCSHGHKIKNSPQWNRFVDDHPKLATKIMLHMLSGKYSDVGKKV